VKGKLMSDVMDVEVFESVCLELSLDNGTSIHSHRDLMKDAIARRTPQQLIEIRTWLETLDHHQLVTACAGEDRGETENRNPVRWGFQSHDDEEPNLRVVVNHEVDAFINEAFQGL
jgi:hypothetical protein